MKVAVLAVQGAFIEHQKKLENLGVSCIELRNLAGRREYCPGEIVERIGYVSSIEGKDCMWDAGACDLCGTDSSGRKIDQ